MKKALKIILWSILTIVVLAVAGMGFMIYKIRYGLPIYETKVPVVDFPADRPSILLFSKTTGFRHGESIEAGKKAFAALAKKNNWYLYSTEEGGVFNPAQLAKFDVVIFNNCTGRLLNDEQKKALTDYVNQGGTWLGIHGSGDNSHGWAWYEQNLVGAHFSHHPIEHHLQKADVTLNPVPDTAVVKGLPQTWTQTDEWYVFLDNPRANGSHVIYNIDGTKIDPSGNILWEKNKNFGMGKDHTVAWYREVGKGRSYYTSLGHDSTAWQKPAFVGLLENEVKCSVKKRN